MTQELERAVIDLVATDRLYIPSSSFDGKLKRRREKKAKAIVVPGDDYEGQRSFARVEEEDKQKARGMKEGVAKFVKEFPKYGRILKGMIEEQRTVREKHLHFGMQDKKRLTRDDYLEVLSDMKLGPETAERYLDVALDISRTLTRQRGYADRSVMIG
ncbi:MAG: hypothetical protein ABIH37_01355 [archaeon]